MLNDQEEVIQYLEKENERLKKENEQLKKNKEILKERLRECGIRVDKLLGNCK